MMILADTGFVTTVTLQAPYDFSVIWKAVCAALLILAIILFIIPNIPHKKLSVKKPDGPSLEKIRKKSLSELSALKELMDNGSIGNREAYQRLSGIVRSFVYGATGIRVTTCTFEEIRSLNMPNLTALVHDYYEPEFAYDSKGEFERSFRVTSDLIRRWN